ncbi:DUF1641 domain-containing protein [Archaeoglobales archaeon]|nr:MAG: DUF1641 domain-containing protein [Archaeoglobales archaeon]
MLYEIIKKLSSNGDDILKVLDKVIYLEKSGMLDEFLKLAELGVKLAEMTQESLDSEVEELITKDAEILMSLGIVLADDKTRKVVTALEEALLNINYEPVGLMGLLKAMREPEVKKAIGFLIGFLREFGRRL